LLFSEVPEFKVKPQPLEINQGETAVFSTTIDAFPIPKIIWSLNNKPLTVKDQVTIDYDQKTGEAKLSIPNVNLQWHSGHVTCKLENANGQAEETVNLDVLSSPQISAQLVDKLETIEGKDVTLKASVKCFPTPVASWFYNDHALTSDVNKYEIIDANGEYQLIIKHPTVANNEGQYHVVFKNNLGEVKSTSCLLTVLEPVEIKMISPKTDQIDLKVGEKFEIECEITGKDSPKVTMLKDNKPESKFVAPSDSNQYKLTIDSVKPEHQGQHKILGKNKVSQEEKMIQLNITGRLSLNFV
jgi:hypothetical protein